MNTKRHCTLHVTTAIGPEKTEMGIRFTIPVIITGSFNEKNRLVELLIGNIYYWVEPDALSELNGTKFQYPFA